LKPPPFLPVRHQQNERPVDEVVVEPVVETRAVDDHGRFASGEFVRELFDVV
jgi:hypothetical protein